MTLIFLSFHPYFPRLSYALPTALPVENGTHTHTIAITLSGFTNLLVRQRGVTFKRVRFRHLWLYQGLQLTAAACVVVGCGGGGGGDGA